VIVETPVIPLTRLQRVCALNPIFATKNMFAHILRNVNGESKSNELKNKRKEKEKGTNLFISNSKTGLCLENLLSWSTKVLDVVLDSATAPPPPSTED
jgi:hypothetical protein